MQPDIGTLVVFPREPALGVGRLERVIDVDGVAHGRVLLYDTVGFALRPLAQIEPCPPGVWDRDAAPRR